MQVDTKAWSKSICKCARCRRLATNQVSPAALSVPVHYKPRTSLHRTPTLWACHWRERCPGACSVILTHLGLACQAAILTPQRQPLRGLWNPWLAAHCCWAGWLARLRLQGSDLTRSLGRQDCCCTALHISMRHNCCMFFCWLVKVGRADVLLFEASGLVALLIAPCYCRNCGDTNAVKTSRHTAQ